MAYFGIPAQTTHGFPRNIIRRGESENWDKPIEGFVLGAGRGRADKELFVELLFRVLVTLSDNERGSNQE